MGVDDGLQFAKDVRATQHVRGFGVGVVGGPRVVDRDAGEPGQHTGVVDRFAATSAVHVQQREQRSSRAVQPMQPALDSQPDLVEVDQRCLTQCLAHQVGEPARHGEVRGSAFGRGPDRAFTDSHPEQVADGLGGALFGQELSDVQVGDRGQHPRAVLDRGVHPIRGTPGRADTATALPGDELMFGHPDRDRWQVEHLTVFGPHLNASARVEPAAGTPRWFVPNDLIRAGDLPQRATPMPVLPTWAAPRLAAQRLRRRLTQTVRGRRLGGVPRRRTQSRFQVYYPRLQLDDHLLQRRDQLLLGTDENDQLLIRRFLAHAFILFCLREKVRRHTDARARNTSSPNQQAISNDLTSYLRGSEGPVT